VLFLTRALVGHDRFRATTTHAQEDLRGFRQLRTHPEADQEATPEEKEKK
jgi:hypothetical protein